MGTMKNSQVSDQNSKRFRFCGYLNSKGYNPILPSWITMLILKGYWRPITSLLWKLLVWKLVLYIILASSFWISSWNWAMRFGSKVTCIS